MIRIGTYGFHFASFMNTIFNELHQRQVKYDVHKTSIIKSIHACVDLVEDCKKATCTHLLCRCRNEVEPKQRKQNS